MKTYKILSIDAWREGSGWTWNNWFTVGHIEKIPASNRAIAKLMRDEGYLLETSKGKIRVTDDQYNIVIEDKSNGMPLFAIEYGCHQ